MAAGHLALRAFHVSSCLSERHQGTVISVPQVWGAALVGCSCWRSCGVQKQVLPNDDLLDCFGPPAGWPDLLATSVGSDERRFWFSGRSGAVNPGRLVARGWVPGAGPLPSGLGSGIFDSSGTEPLETCDVFDPEDQCMSPCFLADLSAPRNVSDGATELGGTAAGIRDFFLLCLSRSVEAKLMTCWGTNPVAICATCSATSARGISGAVQPRRATQSWAVESVFAHASDEHRNRKRSFGNDLHRGPYF